MTLAKVEELIQHPPAPLVSVIARQAADVVARLGDRAERVRAEFLLGDYERTLHPRPGVGRFLDVLNRPSGEPNTVVVSDRLWREWFVPVGAAPGSATLLVDGREFNVIGAASSGFRGVIPYQPVEIWLPATARPRAGELTFAPQIFVKAPPGMSARAVADAVQSALAVGIDPLSSDVFEVSAMAVDALGADRLDRVGWIILAFGALLMMAGAVNVLNLLQVFFSARSREFATRRALGASAFSLATMCVAEIGFLVIFAAALGLFVAWGLLSLVDRGGPLALASGRAFQWRSDAMFSVVADQAVIAYLLTSTLIAACVLSLLAMTRVLRVSSTSRLIGASARPRRFFGRQLLLSLQVAIATILMLSTATFITRLMPSLDAQPAIDTAGVASARIDLSLHGYSDVSGREFYERLLIATSKEQGVGAAALTDGIPGYSYVSHPSFQIVAEPKAGAASNAPRNFVNGSYAGVSEKFFNVMRLPILKGRGVVASDGYGAPLVTVVSESVANRLWPGAQALDKRIMFGSEGHWRTVVGVSADPIRVRKDDGVVCRACVVFVPFQQRYSALMVMLVQSDSASHGASLLGNAIGQANRDVIPFDLGSLDATLLSTLWRQRGAMLLVGAIGIVALLIAAAGIFTATAYVVDLRAFEIAVRTALGATPRTIVGLVLRDVRVVTLIGLLAGVTVMSLGERGFAALLKGFIPNDLWTWAAVLVLVPAVTVAAGYVPARRSTRSVPARLLSRGDR